MWASPTNSPVRLGFFLSPQPPQVFTVRSFEALFPCAGTLGCAVCLAPQLFLLVYVHMDVELPGQPATASPTLVLWLPPCHESSPRWLLISAPPTGLDEYFFFNSLVVELPYSLIFWHVCLFFAFKFGVVLLLVV